MTTLTPLWRKTSLPDGSEEEYFNRQVLAGQMSLIAVGASLFFVLYNLLTAQTFLAAVNTAMTLFYLGAYLLLRNDKITIGKTLLVLSVSVGIFLASSVAGRQSGNYVMYFPVVTGTFLLFGIRHAKVLIINLFIPLTCLLVLEWTDYGLLARYRESDDQVTNRLANIVVSMLVTGLALYYAQRMSLRAEEALRENQQSLLAIIENTSNAIWSVDIRYRLVTFNSTLRSDFRHGYGIDLVKGNNIFTGLPPEEQAVWYAVCERAFRGERFVQEMHYEFPGRVFDVEVSVNPIRSAAGTVTGASFFSKNITKRKKSEATLRFHANVLAQVDDAVIGMDNERHITYWNTGARSLYKLTAHEVMGKKIDEVYGTEWIQPQDEQLAQDTLRSTGSCRMEVIHVLSGDRRIYVDTNTHVWQDENGHAIGLLAVTRDITRSKQAEAASHKTGQTLTSLLENSQNIIFAVDREYRYIAFNHQHKDAIKQLYNIDIQPGMSLEEFTREVSEDRNKMFSLLDRALSGEQFIITEPFGNPDLVRRHFEHAFTSMRDAAGRVVGVTVFSLDITERIESQQELKRINFELDSFVYRSSHDMRAPLRSILGLVSLIREEHDPAQQGYYLELMEKSVQKLDTFITDMTDFSRNSRLEVAVVPIDFGAIIAGCAENLRYMENAGRVALRVQVDASEPFCSDPHRISTVFQNLMSNSVKYQRLYIDDPYIGFNIRVAEQQVQILYTDNGKGIDNEYLPKIFDMFFRASADSYGSGLGLYITDQVIRKMNGTIRVESQLGQGSSFIITLPNLKTEAAIKEPMMM